MPLKCKISFSPFLSTFIFKEERHISRIIYFCYSEVLFLNTIEKYYDVINDSLDILNI